MTPINKVTIIGSGPAGYTAAIYAARAAGTGCMAAIDAERWMIEHGG